MSRDRVLLVEDEPTIRWGIREFLEAKGYEVEEAGDLGQARAAFARQPPDLAVLDYALPDGTALELLEELRASAPGVPLILLTAHGSIDLAVQAIKGGAENFLTKPVELPVLHDLVQSVIGERRQPGHRRRADLQFAAGLSHGAAGSIGPIGPTGPTGLAGPASTVPTGERTLAEVEKSQIETVLQEERGRVVTAARRLGIPRSTLYQKIRELRINLAQLKA